jgi:small nuclear ribonucleoprotein (snRNP)-like protein
MTFLEAHQTGPFELLFDCFKHHTPVKVVIRSAASIRGTCTGTLIGYDKHMNLVGGMLVKPFSIP